MNHRVLPAAVLLLLLPAASPAQEQEGVPDATKLRAAVRFPKARFRLGFGTSAETGPFLRVSVSMDEGDPPAALVTAKREHDAAEAVLKPESTDPAAWEHLAELASKAGLPAKSRAHAARAADLRSPALADPKATPAEKEKAAGALQAAGRYAEALTAFEALAALEALGMGK